MSEAEIPPVPTAVFLTRREAGMRLGLSISMIRKLEKQRILRARKRKLPGASGYEMLYREEDVDALARTRASVGDSVASVRDAQVFAAFREGKSVVDVVIEKQLAAEVVERLWKVYERTRIMHEGAPPAPPSVEELEARERRDQAEHEERMRKGFEDFRRSVRRVRVPTTTTTKRRVPA
jgi:hypothetical protein